MRQAGFMAAAGIYALDHLVERLKQDHEHATLVAEALSKKDFVKSILPVETNIIIFEVVPNTSSKEIQRRLEENGLLTIAISPTQVRLLTHLDLSAGMIESAISIIQRL